jgi:hypothetical protein
MCSVRENGSDKAVRSTLRSGEAIHTLQLGPLPTIASAVAPRA